MKLKEQEALAARCQPVSAVKEELVMLGVSRRSLDAIGPDASLADRLKNENELLKADMAALAKEKRGVEDQLK